VAVLNRKSKCIDRDCAESSPKIASRSVVFPEPEGPVRMVRVLYFTWRLIDVKTEGLVVV
jgi:hypothetical protein